MVKQARSKDTELVDTLRFIVQGFNEVIGKERVRIKKEYIVPGGHPDSLIIGDPEPDIGFILNPRESLKVPKALRLWTILRGVIDDDNLERNTRGKRVKTFQAVQ